MKNIILWLAPLLSLGLYSLSSLAFGLSHEQSFTLAVTLLCALWWAFEPIPLAITAFIPIALFPMFGILSKKLVAESYGNSLIILLLGGFILSTAMAKSGTHRRLALYMVNLFGAHDGRRLVMGFMTASAVLSMWISNTATTLMLLPIAIAVLSSTDHRELDKPLLLGIGYAASVGGIGTPIGTPPNLIFQQVYLNTTQVEIDFITWMSWAIPVVIVFIPIMGLWLTRRCNHDVSIQLPTVAHWRTEEKRVLIVFGLTALAWVTRKQPFGGWSEYLGLPGANDASVALLAVAAMFLVPSGKNDGSRLLDWDSAKDIPWHVLLLFAGGITLASAFQSTGLSSIIGGKLSYLASTPTLIMIAVIALTVTFLTEVTSNTATTTLLMPILASAAIATNIEPAILMVPAALSASCAFMLPAATAPNAVIYSSNRITVKDMIQNGVVLNLIGVFIISMACYFLIA